MIHPATPSFCSARSGRSYLACRLSGVLSLASRIGRGVRVDAGTTIVEFAMASTILFTLVFGVIAICLALYSYNVVAESAREATRYAIVRGSACTSFATACPATKTDIETYVRSLGFPGINPASASLWVNTDCCWPTNNNPGSTVQVTVNYTFPLVIPFVPSRTLTMSSTSAMVISQ
jgi:Flp pilus assembly protein TadG